MRLFLLVVLASTACVKRVDAVVSPRAVQLLHDTPERETAKLEIIRDDVEFDTKEQPREAHVVATGETGLLESNGGRVRLFGDEKGTLGFAVDNIVLLELLAPDGKVLDRAAVGFTEGVLMGRERVDLMGRQTFNFDAGEINLSNFVPEKGPWKLRAVVLDNFGVGKVSDLWLLIDAGEKGGDELRGQ
jgi:hypothetical protein